MGLISALKVQWDRALAVLLALAGALALLLGYVGISSEVYPARQMPYIISGGLVGIFLLGISATLWLSADLRDEWRELYAVRTFLGEGLSLTESGPTSRNGAAPSSDEYAQIPERPDTQSPLGGSRSSVKRMRHV